ncbi:ABC transporter permease subunit, partial [Klebsiella pneumoniae]|uniref:ABC transporter permease subunit n=1 Tax=Klebsiella pneumoniae TaxID=573 RepID=UPI00391FBEDB
DDGPGIPQSQRRAVFDRGQRADTLRPGQGVGLSVAREIVDPLMGVLIGLKAFAAAVLGGIGSVTGAVLGGFILGFTEVVAVSAIERRGTIFQNGS